MWKVKIVKRPHSLGGYRYFGIMSANMWWGRCTNLNLACDDSIGGCWIWSSVLPPSPFSIKEELEDVIRIMEEIEDVGSGQR